ncbi:MAG: DUF3226 domain-containing protein [Candidatus Desantisbacteria bacterium]
MEERTQKKLLVVEGKDEEKFFGALLNHLKIIDIQISSRGGKTGINDCLLHLKTERGFNQLCSLGIVRDADTNPSSAFQSVCDALRKAGLPVPKAPLITTEGDLRVGVMILPEEDCPGALEDLCLKSVKEDLAILCVEGYFQCLNEKGIHVPTDEPSAVNVAISKAKVHAFLASRKNPEKRLGEAAHAGDWNLESSAFDNIKQFLQAL